MGFISDNAKKQKAIKYVSLCTALLLCFATLFVYFSSFSADMARLEDYPLEGIFSNYNPYVQQLDAFLKGQLHFDYEADPRLEGLENPYNPDHRKGIFYLWDRAYFEGNYYSYFGIAPIFTVMLPCYLLTGSFAGEWTMQLTFMLIFALFMCLLVFMLAEKAAPNVNPLLWGLVSYTAVITSLQFLFARGYNSFYYIAVTSAMAFLAGFAFFFFKGIFSKKLAPRLICFTVAGLFFALSFHSRINTAFTAAFFIIPCVVFGIVLKKREIAVTEEIEASKGFGAFCKKHDIGKIIAELACLSFFVIIGFILAFAYNKARFGNILDFGTNYQLTVADVSTYELRLNDWGQSIFHFFLAPFGITNGLDFGYYTIGHTDRYLYMDAHFGILQIPTMWAAFVHLFNLKSKDKSLMLRIGTLCALAGCFVIAWIDYCLGGVIFRYLCDFSAIFACLAALGLILIFEKIGKLKKPWAKYILTGLVILLILFSLYGMFKIMAIDNKNLWAMDENSLFAKLFTTAKK